MVTDGAKRRRCGTGYRSGSLEGGWYMVDCRPAGAARLPAGEGVGALIVELRRLEDTNLLSGRDRRHERRGSEGDVLASNRNAGLRKLAPFSRTGEFRSKPCRARDAGRTRRKSAIGQPTRIIRGPDVSLRTLLNSGLPSRSSTRASVRLRLPKLEFGVWDRRIADGEDFHSAETWRASASNGASLRHVEKNKNDSGPAMRSE